MNEIEQNYLAHHGILGQRWHKRNGPPYPLDAGDHSKSEKEAGYKKSLGGGRNEEMYDRKAKKKEAKRVTKQLNKIDQEMAFEKRWASEHLDQVKRLDKKASKRAAKGKELSERDQKRLDEHLKGMEDSLAKIDAGKKETQRILDSIDKSEFNIRSEETLRNVKTGKEFAAEVIAATATGLVMPYLGAGVGVVVVTGRHTKGTEYKVKAKSDKQKAREATDRDQNNRLNANEILRYSGSKYKKDANKYIKNMSDSAIKKEVESWREAAESFKPGGEYEDAETVKEYIENAKYYERELARRNK